MGCVPQPRVGRASSESTLGIYPAQRSGVETSGVSFNLAAYIGIHDPGIDVPASRPISACLSPKLIPEWDVYPSPGLDELQASHTLGTHAAGNQVWKPDMLPLT